MSDSEAGTPVNVPDARPAPQQPAAGFAHTNASALPKPVVEVAVHGRTDGLNTQHDGDDKAERVWIPRRRAARGMRGAKSFRESPAPISAAIRSHRVYPPLRPPPSGTQT